MATKTTRNKQPRNVKETIVDAALALAADKGWAQVSLRDIAKKARLSLSILHEHCEDKGDILALLGRQIDKKVLDAVGDSAGQTPERDRLFEVMMERFDALQAYRAGLVSILDSFIFDPKQAVLSLPHLCRSMNWMLEVSGIDTNGPKGAAKILGLTIVYLKVLRDWKEDESEDLSRTMASLDQALGHAESLVTRLHL